MPSYSLLFRGYYLISNMHLQSAFRIAWKRFTNFSPLVFLVKQVVPFDTIAVDSFLRVIQLGGLKERVIVDLPFLSQIIENTFACFEIFYIFTRSFRFESVLWSNFKYRIWRFLSFIFRICKRVDKMKCLVLDYNWLKKRKDKSNIYFV